MRKAKGTETPEGKLQIAVKFDPEMFDHLAREAAAIGSSFSALVRFYVKQGMKQDEPR